MADVEGPVKGWLAAGVLVALIGAFFYGRAEGAKAVRLELAEQAADRQETIRKLEADRLRLQQERNRLATELEDAARNDPVSNPSALSVDRVRRLERIK